MILLLCAAYPFIEFVRPERLFAAEHSTARLVHHYEYVFPDGFIYVYDTDHNFALIKTIRIPTNDGVRGSVASAVVEPH